MLDWGWELEINLIMPVVISLFVIFLLLIKFAHRLLTLYYFIFLIFPFLCFILYGMTRGFSNLIDLAIEVSAILISVYYFWWEILNWKYKSKK